MRKENNRNPYSYEKSMSSPVQSCPPKSCPVTSPPRPSLFKTLEEVKRQVGYSEFGRERPNGTRHIDPFYRELCLIIAEVLVKPPDSTLRIRGATMETAIVQEVYRELEHEHVELVAENFKAQTHLIRQKTPYLQTALYNALFELDAHYANLVKHDGIF